MVVERLTVSVGRGTESLHRRAVERLPMTATTLNALTADLTTADDERRRRFTALLIV